MLDRKGEYLVLSVGYVAMTYRYLTEPEGTEHVGEIDVKSRIHANILAEREQKSNPPVDHRFDAWEEWLVAVIDSAWLQVNLTEKALDKFQQRYHAITGEWVDDDHVGLNVNDNVWGLSMTVEFREDVEDLVPAYQHVTTSKNVRRKISNNELVWRMIEIGFRLGCEDHRSKVNRRRQ